MLKKERELRKRILVLKIGSLGGKEADPESEGQNEDKPTVTVGVQTGDVPSPGNGPHCSDAKPT